MAGQRVIQTADDVTTERPSLDAADVLRQSTLAAAVKRRDGVALGDIAQLIIPVATAARITVEHQHGRARGRNGTRAQELRMHPGATDTGEIEVEALSERSLELGRDQLHLGVQSPHLGQTLIPENIKVCRARVDTSIRLKLL